MNFAGVFQTPTLFLCQNNQWAISIPREHQTRSRTLAQKALAYGIPGLQVDGNDPLAVYVATREAAERARRGDGPSLIECVTYRLSVHTTADDPGRYRDDSEVERWRKRDPIPRFQRYLRQRELLDDEALEALEAEISEQLEQAWEQTQQEMQRLGDPRHLFEHVYAQMPPYLAQQRDAMTRPQKED
jgi:TPP-dependent pyruvate/acetoin dehydrogenase alpha subunit